MSIKPLTLLQNKLHLQGSIQIEAQITPKSQQNQIIDTEIAADGKIFLKLKIRGVPEKGQVNLELIKFLAKMLDLPKSNFEIISGHTNRHKIIRIIK